MDEFNREMSQKYKQEKTIGGYEPERPRNPVTGIFFL